LGTTPRLVRQGGGGARQGKDNRKKDTLISL
jgi:hypothetical protein